MLYSQAIPTIQQYLASFAASDSFEVSIKSVFGSEVDRSKLLDIRQQWLSGDFGLIPEVRVLGQGELGTANGAYAASLDQILISADFLGRQGGDVAAVAGLLLEEFGHKLDRLFNGAVDTVGDEGAIFRLLVTGADVSPEVLAGLSSVVDHGVVVLDGEFVEIEKQDFTGTAGNDTIVGTIGNDNISGLAGNDSLSGGSGNDTLEGSVGNNTVNGDADNDLIRSISSGDVIDGGADNDFLSYDFSAQVTGVSISFTNGVGSTSTGGTVNNIEQLYFTGSTGNDTVDATSTSFTNAYYIYEPGSELYGGNGNDILRSGVGNDSLRGDAGNDSLSGGSGNDTLEGSVGNNTVNGDADNDLIRSISSGDVIDGGADNDFLSYDFSAQVTGVSISFTNGVGSTSTGGTVNNIEQLYFTGSTGNDTVDATSTSFTNAYYIYEPGSELYGGNGNDILRSGVGNDSLRGDAGNDSLSGGSGNDTLEGSVGNNTVNGDADNDLIRSISSGDVIDGGADNDFLSYDFSAQVTGVSISFTNGVGSTSTGGTVNNIEQLYFTGSTGNDTVDATSTSFTNAYYIYEPGSELYGGNGNDILRSGVGNDSLRGDAGNDSLSGGSGNDTLEGSVGNNTVNGDADNDLIRSISSGDVIDGGADNDFLSYDFSAQVTGVSISFTNGVGSTSTGGTVNNIEQLYFTGSTGNDTVDATSTSFTNAYYIYEPGSELYGGNGNDILRSGVGNDSLRGDAGNDSLSGGSGNDTLEGSVGNNTVNGDADNDLIRSISSGDVIDGGADNDFLSYDFSAQVTGVSISFTNGVGSTSTGGTVNNIEQLYFTGSTGNDTVDATSTSFTNAYYIYEPGSELYGGNGNDILRSGVGNDSLRGDAGNDSLSGGSGNDTLEGSVGNNTVNGDADNDLIRSISSGDVIDGGADNDFLSYDFSAQVTGVSIFFTNGVGSTSTGGTVNNIEQLYFTGSTGNDTVDATSTSFTNAYYIYEPGSELYGGNGNDILRSGVGNDSLRGDAGNDSLSGGSGNDTLEGGSDSDTLIGASSISINPGIGEKDYLTGGLGIDRFILGDSANIYYDDRNITTAGNNDYATITDFNPLEDQIQLQGAASNYRLQVSGTNTNLYIDKAGTEPDELIAVFQNANSLNLTSSAFIYVPPNTPPTAVTLSNITNSLPENTSTTNRLKVADISITDDAFGINTLSLSGADANLFEIFTGGLYIKAGTNLDFETKPSYAVTVAVDDTLIGATPDATTNYNLTLTDVLEPINGTAGNDTLIGTSDNDTINGFAGEDYLNGGIGNDYINGGDGNDVIDGSGDSIGLDTFVGGAGDDAYGVYNSATIVEDANGGTDTVWTTVNHTLAANIETLYLVGDLVGTGNNGDNTIVGYGLGNNNISGLDGNDTIDGGTGNDTINGGLGNDSVVGGDGNDVIDGSGDSIGLDTFVGGAGDDAYGVYNSATVITEDANGGTDTAWTTVNYALAANIETLYLVGDLVGTGNNGDNTIFGYGLGNNTISGLDGNDTIDGGTGNDTINGGLGNDSVIGGDGNDVIDGSGDSIGLDTFVGGAGDDVYAVYNSATVIVEDANGGIDTVWTAVNYTLANNVESLYLVGDLVGTGDDGDNTIVGYGLGNNTISGLGGNDTIDGGTGNDYLNGGLGNDSVVGGDGNDVIDGSGDSIGLDTFVGGAGDDVYAVYNSATVIVEDANGGIDTVWTAVNYTLTNNVESLYLVGDLVGTGNNGDNTIVGYGLGNNNISGLGGNDTIDGGTGNDYIDGGEGADSLSGGDGADTFAFQFGQSAAIAADRVADFTINTDKISLFSPAGIAAPAPVSFYRANNDATSTNLIALAQAVYSDADGATAGNQQLVTSGAALVVSTGAGIAGTYLLIDDGIAGFSSSDLVVNITGYSGTLPTLGSNSVNTFF